MSQPFFSCICLTAGRTALLEEVIAAFERQDYQGRSELVILNTLPEQQLELSGCDRVHIVNAKCRPLSLGNARNMAINEARGDWFVTWDDDDQYLPNHLSNFAAHAEGNDWLWMNRQFYVIGRNVKSIVQGSANVLAFSRTAWERTGGYRNMNCGEDRDFVGRVTSSIHGSRIELPDDKISFLYAWGQGVYHQSGMGDDKPGRATSWDRAYSDLKRRLANRQIKPGAIQLKPTVRHDYEAAAREFVTPTRKPVEDTRSVGKVAVVLLGRFGDIINILPVVRHIAETYARPTIVVSRDFASLLDGVGYADVLPVDMPNETVKPAIALAKSRFKHVIVAQPWGKDWAQQKRTAAYNRESWRLAGFEHKFDDPTWFPVFDRRNLVREEALVNALGDKRPMLLCKLQGSVSSPWLGAEPVGRRITTSFGEKFNIVHLGTVRAERLYDLLGLMSRAVALVSIDTSMLHLAAASAVPVVALVNPKPWLGTVPRCRCVRRITYAQAEASPKTVIEAITEAIDPIDHPRLEMSVVQMRQPPSRKLVHAYERHDDGMDARKRKAQLSWQSMYGAGAIAKPLTRYPRDAHAIGEKRCLPFLKDVLANAMQDASEHDLILFTNDDVALHPELFELLMFHCAVYGPVSSQRCDFRHLPPLSKPPSAFAKLGKPHLGRDLFCFPKMWLEAHWHELPDFILGASSWDLCVAAMIRLEYGIATTRQNISENILPAELERGYVAHEAHDAAWTMPGNHNSASEKWNKSLFKSWADKHLPTLKFNLKNEI